MRYVAQLLHVYTPDVDDFCTGLIHASNAGHCGAVFNTNAIPVHVLLAMQRTIMMRSRRVDLLRSPNN